MSTKSIKSEHERISELEEQVANILSGLGSLAADVDELNRSRSSLVSLSSFGIPFFPTAPLIRTGLTEFLETDLLLAIPPLPNTIAQGSSGGRCGNTIQVHRVTGNANLSCVVENTGRCGTVTIQLKRGNNVQGQSPAANRGNTASFGPIAAQANDLVEVVCGGTSGQCKFNWQVNKA